MKLFDFEKTVNVILKNSLNVELEFNILKNQSAKKWYEKTYYRENNEIESGIIYGVFYDDMYRFDFKTTNVENLLKSFLNKFASKYEVFKTLPDGRFTLTPSKKETLNKIIDNNKDRVFKGLFYTTLYGIGFWAIFCNKNSKTFANEMHKYLSDKNIAYKNEFSDAFWVYRFLIKQDVKYHNELLTNFNI